MVKICHLTSVHSRNDTRIFLKQCRSLAANEYDVILIVSDDIGDQVKGNVHIIDVGKLHGRFNRIFKTTRIIYNKSVDVDADIYQLHDPELILAGLMLKRLGKKVIFDSHEDVPKQLLVKPYLNKFSLLVLSNLFALFERFACARFDGILTATSTIRDKFLDINQYSLDVNNFPLLGELDSSLPWGNKCNEVSYVGGIAKIRGICEIVRACNYLKSNTRLNLVGNFSVKAMETEVKTYAGWSNVVQHGFLDRVGVRNVLSRSVAGLVTFHPIPNHVDAQPNKMFEYMSSGIPVIASNFPLWREIIEGNDCGICIDPLDPKAIAEAIDFLVQNPDIARRMGENGRKAVLDKYNWSIEEKKLLDFYLKLLGED